MEKIYKIIGEKQAKTFSNNYQKLVLDNIFKDASSYSQTRQRASFLKGLQSFFFTAPLK